MRCLLRCSCGRASGSAYRTSRSQSWSCSASAYSRTSPPSAGSSSTRDPMTRTPPETDAPKTSGRARSRGQIAIALTLALLGFLLATQLRAQQGLTQRLGLERESDLGQILTTLSDRSDQLQSQIVDLRVKLAQASGTQAQQHALIDDARQQLQALQILLGLVPVKGPGVDMLFGDPQG